MAAADRWDATLYEDKHSFVWKLGAQLIELLAPCPGERILELGCGTGHLAAQIAAAGAEVVGIDSSPAMIEQARTLYPALHFKVGDARRFTFPEAFDAVFSNATLHWIREPVDVIRSVSRALKPSGRFVAEFGGKGNVQGIVASMDGAAELMGLPRFRHPWYYPSIGEYAPLLEESGLQVTYAALFDRWTPLEGDDGLSNWVRMFGSTQLAVVPLERQAEFLKRVEEAAGTKLYREGKWHADYRRLRVVATGTPFSGGS